MSRHIVVGENDLPLSGHVSLSPSKPLQHSHGVDPSESPAAPQAAYAPRTIDRRGRATSSLSVKRAIDIVGSALALLILAVPLLLGALTILVTMGPPVLFVQERPGRNGETFRLRKFRTMTDARDADGALLPDPQRVTRLGRMMRASSFDELPELVNVIRGDMSLVGPRPLLVRYLPLYTPEQARRHEVLPGMTGLAQVRGRTELDWEETFALDVWYADHRGLWLDLKILVQTAWLLATGLRRNARSDLSRGEFVGTPGDGGRPG